MAEDLTLTDPIQPPTPPAKTKIRVVGMRLDMEEMTAIGGTAPAPGMVDIRLRDNTGLLIQAQYTGPEAIDLMKWMNTANFSVNSMQKRVLQKLSADGKLPPGTVTGTPDSPSGGTF